MTATAGGVSVRSWWDHDGPFAMILTGLGGGDLVIPVRLPQGPGRRPVLEHYLAYPDGWHKIDLVRHRDPGAAGGWRYEAHLMVLGPGYTSPAVTQRRQAAALLERRGGVDVNVSNLTVVSVPVGPDGGLAASRVARTGDHDAVLVEERLRQRRRNRALDRSRRAANPGQYRLSPRQQRRADRRRAVGLPPVQVTVPGGPRVANTVGIPVRAYRHDIASSTYRRLRGRVVADGAARTKAGHTRARITAAALVAVHGAGLVVEDADIRVWARRWGRGIHAFTPGMLLTALRRETTAVVAHTGRGPGPGTPPGPSTAFAASGSRRAWRIAATTALAVGWPGTATSSPRWSARTPCSPTPPSPAPPGSTGMRRGRPSTGTGSRPSTWGCKEPCPSQPEPTTPTPTTLVDGRGGRSPPPASTAGGGALGEPSGQALDNPG
ncbi:hypothetical protein AB0M46_32005 [Dactylosporangium sp. NPDC051485]|uniref:hypothetical protein n=1 Tax=Dactylosporangium sp. NPDC051485 TaxID=3154846 RepID=UPI003433A62C